MKISTPNECSKWFEKLTTPQEDLSLLEKITLKRHMNTCQSCSRIHDEYELLKRLMQDLPAPNISDELPEELLKIWEEEDHNKLVEQKDAQGNLMLKCRECGNTFLFTLAEQEFYESRGLINKPGRCPDCRHARRGSLRSRQFHSINCSECGIVTEVPFLPKNDRPIYCSDCYNKVHSKLHSRS